MVFARGLWVFRKDGKAAAHLRWPLLEFMRQTGLVLSELFPKSTSPVGA
jgi:hypothetical protein